MICVLHRSPSKCFPSQLSQPICGLISRQECILYRTNLNGGHGDAMVDYESADDRLLRNQSAKKKCAKSMQYELRIARGRSDFSRISTAQIYHFGFVQSR